ncbi:hypothetical protein [Deinococcus ruber]|uniref:Uncharacterized protein n=1 Tax=Deinococcus ruber TaxID=1848197 RepID=A0A918F1K0_9DEIO|nr:hypothetical protein [Deinococcus ruber]GGQ99405.1 hypothetical protein GCM10008957_10240 [Deinococcus ruber]
MTLSSDLHTPADLLITEDERRSKDPLKKLSRELDAACVGALQPQELAAILESEGFTDAMVWERFGEHTVFSAAERLFTMVPYRPQPAALPPMMSPLKRTWPQDLIRGLIYLLPALWSPAALSLGWGEGATTALLIASLFGWGWMQSMSYLGYAGLAASRTVAGKLLRGGGAVVVLMTSVLAALLALVLHQDVLHVTLVATAIAVYLAAATTLLVLGRELLLLLSLLPALLLVLVRLAVPGLLGLEAWTLPAVILTLAVGLPLLTALRVADVRLPTRLSALPKARYLVLKSLPFAGYGWLSAAFLTMGLLLSHGTEVLQGSGWSLAPLVLSMGAMEVTLRRIHGVLRLETRSRDSVAQIVGRAIMQVLFACLSYSAVLLALYDVLVWLAPSFGLERPPLLLLAGHVQVALAMLLSGLLINFSLLPRTLLLWSLAVVTQFTLIRFDFNVTASYTLSSSVLLTVLMLGTWNALHDIRNLS